MATYWWGRGRGRRRGKGGWGMGRGRGQGCGRVPVAAASLLGRRKGLEAQGRWSGSGRVGTGSLPCLFLPVNWSRLVAALPTPHKLRTLQPTAARTRTPCPCPRSASVAPWHLRLYACPPRCAPW